jgi:hypothetical protein
MITYLYLREEEEGFLIEIKWIIDRPIELRKEEKRKNFGRDALLAILILRLRIKEKDRIEELGREIGLRNRVKSLS